MSSFNLYGPINHLGFGVHFTNWAARFISKVAEMGIDCHVFPKGGVQFSSPERLTSIDRILHSARSGNAGYSESCPSICLWHPSETAEFCGHPRIFYTVWEGSKLRPREEAMLSQVDAIWVPTQWHKDILDVMDDMPPSYVVPEGVDDGVFFRGGTGQTTQYISPEDHAGFERVVRFVSVGKIEKRKGMEVALDALMMAALELPKTTKLVLLGHWWNPFVPEDPKEQKRREQAGLPRVPPFYLLLQKFMGSRGFQQETDIIQGGRVVRYTHSEIPNIAVDCIVAPFARQSELIELYRTGHWGMFPHFAEGWGLPLIESMACGLPPITQYYSGPTQYLKEGAFLGVPGQLVQARDQAAFRDGQAGMWSQVNTEALSQTILTAVGMPEEEREQMGVKASEAALQYTWRNAVDTSIEVLREMALL